MGNPDGNGNNRDFLGAAPRDFTTRPAPLGGNPNAGDDPTGDGAPEVAFRRGAVTQLFYLTNWYHDKLFHLGFDEAAGNFQQTNFSGMGPGDDRVRGRRPGRLGHEQRQLLDAAGRHVRPHADVPLHRARPRTATATSTPRSSSMS